MGGLSQNYATREEALLATSRSTRWKVAEPAQIDDGRHYVEFNYRLDITLLPRPMQIGTRRMQQDWHGLDGGPALVETATNSPVRAINAPAPDREIGGGLYFAWRPCPNGHILRP